ncbi:unnamed protein product [Somion occarium]|uniref:Uncharacterized protein n=1 Tax=Somion occarium TaxID=3059160 RepID=A0ABP1DSZ6_9APHY
MSDKYRGEAEELSPKDCVSKAGVLAIDNNMLFSSCCLPLTRASGHSIGIFVCRRPLMRQGHVTNRPSLLRDTIVLCYPSANVGAEYIKDYHDQSQCHLYDGISAVSCPAYPCYYDLTPDLPFSRIYLNVFVHHDRDS